jgi:hypothetical protein
MVDPVRLMARREFTRLGLLGLPIIFCGCGGAGPTAETGPPIEKGGRDRLKLMEQASSKALEKAKKKK